MIIHALHTENDDLVAVVDDVISLVAITCNCLSNCQKKISHADKDIMKCFILLLLFAFTAVIQGDPTLGTTVANPLVMRYAKQKHLGCKKSVRPIRSNMQAGRHDQKL